MLCGSEATMQPAFYTVIAVVDPLSSVGGRGASGHASYARGAWLVLPRLCCSSEGHPWFAAQPRYTGLQAPSQWEFCSRPQEAWIVLRWPGAPPMSLRAQALASPATAPTSFTQGNFQRCLREQTQPAKALFKSHEVPVCLFGQLQTGENLALTDTAKLTQGVCDGAGN